MLLLNYLVFMGVLKGPFCYFRLNMIASKILGLCVILVVASAAQAAFWTQGALSNFFFSLFLNTVVS